MYPSIISQISQEEKKICGSSVSRTCPKAATSGVGCSFMGQPESRQRRGNRRLPQGGMAPRVIGGAANAFKSQFFSPRVFLRFSSFFPLGKEDFLHRQNVSIVDLLIIPLIVSSR